jgi:hypothetical protein
MITTTLNYYHKLVQLVSTMEHDVKIYLIEMMASFNVCQDPSKVVGSDGLNVANCTLMWWHVLPRT